MNVNNKSLFKEYNDKGWIKIKNFLSREDINKINYSLDKFLKEKLKN